MSFSVKRFFQTVAVLSVSLATPSVHAQGTNSSGEEPVADKTSMVFEKSLTGVWSGPLQFGKTLNFIYEFKVKDQAWTGRWQNADKGIWTEIKGLSVTSDSVSFYFETQPEYMWINLAAPVNSTTVMEGTATLKSMGITLPLKLAKNSDVTK